MNVKIEKLDHFGRGITEIFGKICFVENALPGEIVNIKVKSIISDEDKYNSIKDNFKNKEIQYQACSI